MVTQCYNLVTDVNCEKERMYVCESETIVAVVGSLDFGEKKRFCCLRKLLHICMLQFVTAVTVTAVAIIFQAAKRQKLIPATQNKLIVMEQNKLMENV